MVEAFSQFRFGLAILLMLIGWGIIDINENLTQIIDLLKKRSVEDDE